MELGNCFFEYFNKDMEEHRQALRAQGKYSNEEIDKLMSSVKYIKSQRERIRSKLRDPEAIVTSLKNLY